MLLGIVGNAEEYFGCTLAFIAAVAYSWNGCLQLAINLHAFRSCTIP